MLSTIASAQSPVAPTKSRHNMSSDVEEEEVGEKDEDKDEAKETYKKKAITPDVQKRQGGKRREERMKVLTEGRKAKKEVHCSVFLVTSAYLR